MVGTEAREAGTGATYVQLDGLISWAQRRLGLPAIGRKRKEKIGKLVDLLYILLYILSLLYVLYIKDFICIYYILFITN